MTSSWLRIYTNRAQFWTQFSLLFVLTTVAQTSYFAYQQATHAAAAPLNLVATFVFIAGLSIPAILLGLKLGKSLGLGLVNQNIGGQVRLVDGLKFAFLVAVPLALVLLGMRWLLAPYLPTELPEYGFRGPVGGLLVSFGAAIGEEVWFRLGLMTTLLYLCSKIFAAEHMSNKVAVTVIVVVAFGFGLAHLPQLNSYGAADSMAIWATIFGNMAVSGLYGWCFWRYGLLSAMMAHFSVDIVLHMLPAFF